MQLLDTLFWTFLATLRDVLPIATILFGFQFLFLRKRPPNLKRILFGFVYVLVGLTLFLVGLETALFPLGQTMATQLTDPAFIGTTVPMAETVTETLAEAEAEAEAVPAGEQAEALPPIDWLDYGWVYVFAAAIGFATTVAEPSLIAVSLKAEEISGGSVRAFGLRLAVAVGVAAGVAVGAFRIVTGTPLPIYIIVGYGVVILQTMRSSKMIIPLAYDSGGVTTSTVTVPVVTALGLGLASTIPGRNPLIDGFGLIAFASLFPVMSVLGYAMLSDWRHHRRLPSKTESGENRGDA